MSGKTIAVVIVAGGKGSRARLKEPKQYAMVGGVPLLRRTISAFLNHPRISTIQVVIGESDEAHYQAATEGLEGLRAPVIGGESRQASVFEGLKALATDPPPHVLIHDGARPFISARTIDQIIAALQTAEGAIAALPVSDTLKRANSADGIEETVARDGLWRAQTPQGFRFETILSAHQNAKPGIATDDASLLEASGIHVALVPDDPMNIKLTYREDFDLAERLLGTPEDVRTGLGIDVHAFEKGDAVILGGVSIPHTHKLKGHSDADVVLHAITDAIYGALGEGDIGHHFPPSEEKWRGAASRIFLEHAAGLVEKRKGRITHLDVTAICEAPKIGPHREAIRSSIAEMLNLPHDRVSVKATTTEKLGFTGRQEGLMAQAIATLALPRREN